MIAADALCRVRDRPGVWVVGDAGSYPGPDWLAKQAHQADLQAKAVAANIAATLAGRQPTIEFRAELICIVDTLESGILVYRTPSRNFVSPQLRLFHWPRGRSNADTLTPIAKRISRPTADTQSAPITVIQIKR